MASSASLRLANALSLLDPRSLGTQTSFASDMALNTTFTTMVQKLPPHSSHPDFAHLILLVFEAVLEVVCVSLPGYIVARQGMFDANAQKFLANLNVQLFTPCLVFTKLASQLNADKLADLAVIPVIFIVQTFVSWLCAVVLSKFFKFNKRQKNFVIAMGVFGNSNSLPISLVLSLSKTLKGLHWDQRPGDNDDDVAARGILYLLIFQQLGQFVRWTWGFNVLLAPPRPGIDDEPAEERLIEEGQYRDEPEADGTVTKSAASDYVSGSGSQKPETVSSVASSSSSIHALAPEHPEVLPTPANGNIVGTGPGNMVGNDHDVRQRSTGHITQFPTYSSASSHGSQESPSGIKGVLFRVKTALSNAYRKSKSSLATFFRSIFQSFPVPMQKLLATVYRLTAKFLKGCRAFMNPPLWAMLIAIFVASVPTLQHLFFDKGTFLSNSVTRAVAQSGGVAVPLILVVLGGNLARNTLPREELATTAEEKSDERKLLFASLISRMLLPTLIMAPLLALFAKYVPVSILDDPIFVIVCFLLTGAPSALQLAQICQINNVFMGVMSKLLVQSYVIWILPSTLILVMLALEVVEWAKA